MTTSPYSKKSKLKIFLWTGFIFLCVGVTGIVSTVLYINYHLPSVHSLTTYRPNIPLRIYSEDNVLLAEFGAEKREQVYIQDVPNYLKNAILAVEDARFYEHQGIDYVGLGRALVTDILKGHAAQGASTITMQVARNMFLSNEKTISRKLYEILLARQIELSLNKDQILEIYMNEIYLGQRAYGFATAAKVYFGKNLSDITLPEAAMLAGLPKAPSAYNPVVNPQRATIRQQFILSRMLSLNMITQSEYDDAMHTPLQVVKQDETSTSSVHAEYVSEMVRQFMYEQYQEEAYTKGYIVHTTILASNQQMAYQAVRQGVLNYDERHGYQGPVDNITLPTTDEAFIEAMANIMNDYPNHENLFTALVLQSSPTKVVVMRHDGSKVTITGQGLRFVARALQATAPSKLKITPGAVIYIAQKNAIWTIAQQPLVEAALVSITPQNGAIRALVGGFDFTKNHFNHITQAWRQPGSTFKPFVYSAALEKGYGPATTINDAPISYDNVDETQWSPKDDTHPQGLVSVRTAVKKSINLAAIRLLDTITPQYAQTFITEHFGFSPEKIQPYLSMALGAGEVTPLQLVSAYSILANGGYQVTPYFISTITDTNGNKVFENIPLTAEINAPRVLDARNSYIMTSLLKSAAQQGTGALTNQLGRNDLAGKTGTTNNAYDGWFAGYQHSLATVVWMGYDIPKTLGKHEFGSRVSLPIWIDYMREALADVPEYSTTMPEDVRLINGELYYDNITPGHGFKSSVGIQFSDIISSFLESNEMTEESEENNNQNIFEQ